MFCVSIGLEENGRLVLGIVYDPIRRELFEAEAGKGAYLNGEEIHVSRTASLDRALLVTGFAYDRQTRRRNIDHFARFVLSTQGIRRTGTAAIDLCYVAAGRFDGFWEINLNPWDIAAGSLMVTEAGGRVSDFEGKAFSVDGKETLASNGLVHQAMLEVLAGR
jgi:myo-inositol-1(or 4)-monophosphatase